MNVCSDKHEEICFNGTMCPMCELRRDLTEKLDESQEQVQVHEETLADLRRGISLRDEDITRLQADLNTSRQEVQRIIRGRQDGEI